MIDASMLKNRDVQIALVAAGLFAWWALRGAATATTATAGASAAGATATGAATDAAGFGLAATREHLKPGPPLSMMARGAGGAQGVKVTREERAAQRSERKALEEAQQAAQDAQRSASVAALRDAFAARRAAAAIKGAAAEAAFAAYWGLPLGVNPGPGAVPAGGWI